MKKQVLLILLLINGLISHAQTLTTNNTYDWNTVWQSGFYQSFEDKSLNSPPYSASIKWYWGINAAHALNRADYRYNGQILFGVNATTNGAPSIYVRSTNSTGQGIWAKVVHSKGDHAIDGKLTATAVEIKLVTGADFVFKPDYNLMPLSEVEAFIKENQHLPEIPSEKEMVENGVNINEMQIKLLQKIEELTLHVIEQEKQNKKLQEQIISQGERIKQLENK